MALTGGWIHTSSEKPCPICHRSKRGNRCILIPDKVVLCYYVSSTIRRRSNAGECWLHFLTPNVPGARRTTSIVIRPLATAARRNDLHLLARRFKSDCTARRLDALSRQLGISADSLEQFDVGWCDGEPMETSRGVRRIFAWAFPMRDAEGKVTGLRMRGADPLPDGSISKFSFSGGGDGLFIPRDFVDGERAYVCEGATDSPTARDLKLNAFGRSSCSAGVKLVVEMIRHRRIKDLVIFSQRDEVHYRPDGSTYFPAQDGAKDLAQVTKSHVETRVIMPPHHEGDKDVRDWKKRGATAAGVEQLVKEALPHRISITVHIRTRKGNGVCQTKQI